MLVKMRNFKVKARKLHILQWLAHLGKALSDMAYLCLVENCPSGVALKTLILFFICFLAYNLVFGF